MKRALPLVAVSWSLCAVAFAQQGEPKNAKEQARAHFRQGVVLVREGAYGAALVELNRAYELSPDYRVLFNIGQTQLQLGEYVAAIRAFEAYLAQGGAEIEAERRATVEGHLTELGKRVATLTISTNKVKAAAIFVDGARVGEAPLKGGVSVSVGRHQVAAKTPDGASATETIEVAGGDTREVHLELGAAERTQAAGPLRAGDDDAPRTPVRGRPRGKRVGIGLLSAGGALGLGAVITGFFAKAAHDDHQRELAQPRGDAQAIAASRDDMKRYALVTDGLALGALAMAVTGLVLVLVSDDQGERATTPTELKLGFTPGKLMLQGQF